MNLIFNYIFYRVARVYFKWDKRHALTAIIAVTMVQTLLVLDIIGLGIRVFYEKGILKDHVQTTKIIALAMYVALLIVNYLKFEGKYFKYKAYWKEETKEQQFYRGFLVVLALTLPWTPLILMGIL